MALTSEGEVFSWGKSANGRLGHGEVKEVKEISKPKLITFFSHPNVYATSISAGFFHSAATAGM
jgi:alpha-tubulin suppressor-like RCC1 family protein